MDKQSVKTHFIIVFKTVNSVESEYFHDVNACVQTLEKVFRPGLISLLIVVCGKLCQIYCSALVTLLVPGWVWALSEVVKHCTSHRIVKWVEVNLVAVCAGAPSGWIVNPDGSSCQRARVA